MLHLLKMTITNFGPYKGSQEVDFTDREGVNIFWGDNGRGKTTLLNAFRYALFGNIQRRNGVLQTLRDMENIEARKDGVYGFSVVLKMLNDGTVYELTRQYRKRDGVGVPTHDEDYEKRMFLKKGGSVLSQADSEHELNVLMPEQVSRFFLFDGELLQEYEELLENETTTGERIKEAIEKILGVPVLTNGVVDIKEALYNYDKQKQKAAQKDIKTQQLALQRESVDQSLKAHEAEVTRLQAILGDLIKEKMDLDDKSDETEQVRGWMARQSAAKTELEKKEAELNQCYNQAKVLTQDAWKGMLDDTISTLKDGLQNEIAELDQKKQKKVVAESFISELKKACRDHRCPVCDQDISETLAAVLQTRIDASESQYSGLTDGEKDRLLSLQARYNAMRQLKTHSRKYELQMIETRISNLVIEIGTLKQELSELNEKIGRYGDTSEIATIAQRLAAVLSKMDITEKGIKEEKAKVDEDKSKLGNIDDLIGRQNAGADLQIASRQHMLCKQIFDIFDKGMAGYRDRLKQNVERDATELFVKLSGDKDYVGLRIHDNYGLSIIHRSGEVVPGRSSGYEHIVALSLIGALHKNAPLRGPIIMDSPFGRLDPTHKRNIVKQLPYMAEQSMLLAYTGEIEGPIAREALAGSLIREYKLTRVTSMHTLIE